MSAWLFLLAYVAVAGLLWAVSPWLMLVVFPLGLLLLGAWWNHTGPTGDLYPAAHPRLFLGNRLICWLLGHDWYDRKWARLCLRCQRLERWVDWGWVETNKLP